MSSSESEEEQQEQLRGSGKARAPNRHKFKNLAERIDEVDVDVYRRVGQVRSEPLPGATSFFQETLQEWRELSTAQHWLDIERQLRPLSQTLPLLLLHKQRLVDVLLRGLEPLEGPSLPPLFALLVAAARDLQGEIVPHLPAIWARFTWLVEAPPAGAGGASDPDLLQQLFNAAAGLCKVLVKQITAALPATLKHTKGLRYHRDHHVRCLAAETFGFLLRAAPRKALRVGLRALLAEHAVQPSPDRCHGAGLLVAESVLGPEHGLHSKAPALLQLLLQEDLLQPEDFGAAADKAAAKADSSAPAAESVDDVPAAVKPRRLPKGLSSEVLRVRCAAVAVVAFERLWQHTRRGTTLPLWEVLFGVTDRRLAAAEAAAAADAAAAVVAPTAAGTSKARTRKQQQQRQQEQAQGKEDLREEQLQQHLLPNAARGVLLVAQGVHYFRGSRVEDYGPLMKLADRLIALMQQLPVASKQQQQQGTGQQQQLLQLQRQQQQQQQQEEGISWSAEQLEGLTLSHTTLQLLLGISLGHGKEIGASKGLGFLKGPAARWSRVLGFESVPTDELLVFVQGLVMPPSSAALAELFAPQVLGALGKLLLSALGDSSGSNGSNCSSILDKISSSSSSVRTAANQALAGLIEVCSLLCPGAAVGSGSLPLLLTAQPGGSDLAAAVQQLAAACGDAVKTSSSGVSSSKQVLLICWAGLQLLPHAAVKPEQAVEACNGTLAALDAAIDAAAAAAAGTSSSSRGASGCSISRDVVSLRDLLQLRSMVVSMLAGLLPEVAPQQLPQVAKQVLTWIQQPQQQDQQQQQQEQQQLHQSHAAGRARGLDYATASSAALLLEALRRQLDETAGLKSNSASGLDGAAAAAGRGLLSSAQLPAVINALLPSLTAPQQTLRAAALRILCCFDQPAYLGLQPAALSPSTPAAAETADATKQQQQQQEEPGHERAAFEGMRCGVLCTLRDMHTEPCSIQAGRRWSVALERMMNHLEYNRVPAALLPALVAGLIGVLHIRFSPLWQPASKALGEALTQNPATAWPIILQHLSTTQQQFLSGRLLNPFNSSSYDNAPDGGDEAVAHRLGPDLEQQWISFCKHGCSSIAAAAAADGNSSIGGCTDAANRLTNLLKGLAAQASAAALERSASNWVPLLLACAAAVTHADVGQDVRSLETEPADADADADAAAADADGQDNDEGEEEEGKNADAAKDATQQLLKDGTGDDITVAAAVAQQGATEDKAAGTSATDAAAGSKRKQPEQHQHQQHQQRVSKRQRGSSGLAVALNREGLGGLGMSIRAWRGVMMEWLALLGASKAAKRISRSSELLEAVCRQLLSSDPALQASALRCLATFKLPFLPPNLQAFLLQLSDAAKLRGGLINIPMMFDQSLTSEQQRQRQQEQQQRQTLQKGRKGSGGGDVGRVDAHIRPGFVPLMTMVLYPKMAKRSGRLGGKGAPGSARAAVLNALAGLQPVELTPLLELLLVPISSCFTLPQACSQDATATAATAATTTATATAAARVVDEEELAQMESCRLIPAPWWSKHLVNGSLDWWLTAVDRSKLAQQPLRRRQGFLNAFEDLLSHLGFRLQPLLPPLLAITLHLLQHACAGLQQQHKAAAAAAAIDGEQHGVALESREEGRALRSQCLKLFTQVFTRFPAAMDFNPLWPGFFQAVKPLMPRLIPEAVAAAAPPLLATAAALAANPGLARVLGNLPSRQILAGTADASQQQGPATAMQTDEPDTSTQAVEAVDQGLSWAEGSAKPAWAAEGAGGQLLSSCFAVLSAKGCSDGTRDAALAVAESCLALQPPQLLAVVLLPWTSQLLQALRVSVETVLTAAAAAASGGRGRGAAAKGGKGSSSRPSRPSVLRQLTLLEQLGPFCSDTATASSLAEALVALLQPPKSSRSGGSSTARAGGHGGFKRAPLDERGLTRALGALTALWKALQAQQRQQQQTEQQQGATVQQLQQYWEVVALLFGHLSHRESRTATAAALVALGSLLDTSPGCSTSISGTPSNGDSSSGSRQLYSSVAELLVSLNSWSSSSLDEPDYNARLASYSQLQPQLWETVDRLQTLPLLLQSFFDLRNDSDLALRQAAATALTRAVQAYAVLDSQQKQQQQKQQQQAQDAAMEVDTQPPAQHQQQQQQQQPLDTDDPLRLLPRVVYPQVKGGLRSSNLAVRQEHAALLRELVLQLPGKFPDLLPLCSQDPEQDFFLNITHLQIHRRGRALQLLVRLVQQQQPQQQQQDAAAAAAAREGAPVKKRKLQAGAAAQQPLGQPAPPAAAAAAADAVEAGDAQGAGQKRPRHPVPPPPPQQQQQHKPVSARVLMDIAAPLLQQFIFEGAGQSLERGGLAVTAAAAEAERGGHGKKKGDSDREGAVANTAIEALRALAGQLGWQQYSGLLQRWLNMMTQHPRKQIIRAACAVLDAFHFPLDAPQPSQPMQLQPQPPQQQQQAEDGTVDEASDGHDDDADALQQTADAAAEAAADAADIAAAARQLLQVKVLPVLQSQLVVDDQEVARAPVALALVKLIKLLPPEVERVALPRCLTSIAGLLRSRMHSSRDAAREVLSDVSLELGPEYLPTIIKVLRAVLPDKGYTAHVLGYTAAALLEAHVGAGTEPGQLDECVEVLLPTLEGDLFGAVAEAKDVTAFAGKYKEAKRCRAYEAFQHLAAAVTFNSSSTPGSSNSDSSPFDQLLQLVQDKLPSAGSPTIRAKLEQLLTAAARGLAQNPSVTPQALASWIGLQLDACLKVEEAARAKAKAAVGAAVSTAARNSSKSSTKVGDGEDAAGDDDAAAGAAGTGADGDGSAHLYLMSHFCLNVLGSSLRKGLLAGRSAEVLVLLDPLLPLLVRGLASRHMGTVQASLKCLTMLVSIQELPGLSSAAVGAGKGLSSLLRKVPDAAHPLAQDCFKLLGAMLRDCPSYEPPTHHIRFLLKWIAADLQSPAGTSASAAAARVGASGGGGSSNVGERVSGYSLLRAVLGRKLMLPEVYDVMEIVQKQMITSHSAPVRATAAAALLQFLLDYPLSPSRLQRHLLFLLTNTEYEHEEGRLQALEMLQQVFLKFPPAVVANLSTIAYMPLVTRLANETSPKGRSAAIATIKLLHNQLQPEQNDALAALNQQWLIGGRGQKQQQQELLRAVAAQALGLLAEAEGARFGRRLGPDFVQGLARLLRHAAGAAEAVLLSKASAEAADELQEDPSEQPGSSEETKLPWQEVYHVLVMLEKALQGAVSPLLWQQGPAVQQLWVLIVQEMLLYPHLWVRKAAARLLGLALATPGICNGLLSLDKTGDGGALQQQQGSNNCSAGRCALLVYLQLEADVVDEGLCTQAVKCLVALAKHLAAAQPPHQQQQPQQQVANGQHALGSNDGNDASNGVGAVADDIGSSSDDGDDDAMAAQSSSDAEADLEENAGVGHEAAAAADRQEADHKQLEINLPGLIQRMVRLAEDTRFVRQQQRLAALRWLAAVVSAAGTAQFVPHLSLLLRPLYRVAEASGEQKIHAQALQSSSKGSKGHGSVPEEVVVLSDQVMAHLRGLFGAEQLLAAYASAREEVRATRAARKTAAARKALLDPEAAARLKLRRGKKKSESRQRKAEERRRNRSARGSGGFGYKAAKHGGKGQKSSKSSGKA